MGLETIIGGIIVILAAVIPFVLNRLSKKRTTRDNLADVEADELDAGLDALDRLQPPPPKP